MPSLCGIIRCSKRAYNCSGRSVLCVMLTRSIAVAHSPCTPRFPLLT